MNRQVIAGVPPPDGLGVIELGVWGAGPAAGGIMADCGADLIEVDIGARTAAIASSRTPTRRASIRRVPEWVMGETPTAFRP